MEKKILIVEDDLDSLKLIGLMLQRQGYEIVGASSGEQALAEAERAEPDLVVLDVMMPGLDGLQVCRRLRRNPRTAYVPVIMFSAKALTVDKAAGFDAGADEYLTKPIHPVELLACVEELLERAEEARAERQVEPPRRVIGVIGAKGGVGVSTLVVNLAVAIGQSGDQVGEQPEERQVRVVELRPGLGSVALLFGQAPCGGWASLLEGSAENLDRQTVEGQLMTYKGGLRFLPASLHPESGQSFLPPAHVDAVLRCVVAGADVTILDLGSMLDAATRRAIAYCDVLIVAVEPERICLALAQVLLDRIRGLDVAPHDVGIVIVEHSPDDTDYPPEKVEKLLGQQVVGVTGAATQLAREAAERGEPLVLLHPESEIARRFRDLGQAIMT